MSDTSSISDSSSTLTPGSSICITMPTKKRTTTTTTYKLKPSPSTPNFPTSSSPKTLFRSSPKSSSNSNSNTRSSPLIPHVESCPPPAEVKPKSVSFSAEIPRILSRIETLQIVFERAPATFRLFDIALYRLEETVHQLSTMLLALDDNQRQRMDVHGWLEEAGRLLQMTKGVVNEAFEKNGRMTRAWKKMLRVKVEGCWWDRHEVVDLTAAVLEHCVKLSRRYERLVYDLLRDRENDL